MMMFFIPVIKGIGANEKSQQNHPYLKTNMMDNVNTK